MKNHIAYLLAASVLLLAGCGEKKTDNNAAKTFTVGFDAEFPPFGFIADDGMKTSGSSCVDSMEK